MLRKEEGLEISSASVMAIITCIFGIIFGIHFTSFFDLLHMYSFSANYNITVESYHSIIFWVGIAQIIFYSLYIMLASALMVKSEKLVFLTLIIMCVIRLLTIMLLFLVGFYLVFQIGFAFVMEIVSFMLIIYMGKSEKLLKNNSEHWKTIGAVGILGECIPFVRYIQYVFDTNVNITVSITAVLVPCFSAATTYAAAYWTAYPYLSYDEDDNS